MRQTFTLVLLSISIGLFSQNKKPLDHTVYDGWQSFGEKAISNNGKYIVYTVTPQEGDAKLFIQKTSGEVVAEISRGYNAAITEDDKFVVYKIKPFYKDTREARIKKKKPDEMPKDSLGIFSLEDSRKNKLYARIKSYKLPEDTSGWAIILFEKAEEKKAKDSTLKAKKTDFTDSENDFFADDEPAADKKDEGADMVLRNLYTGEEKTFKNVTEYLVNKKAKKIMFEVSPSKKDSTTGQVQVYDITSGKATTIFKKFNDAKGYAMDDQAMQFAFFAERDSSSKSLQKFYKLWYFKAGMDSAEMIADRATAGIKQGWSVSENSNIIFSKSSKRLLFGTAPVLMVRDTTVPDIDRVSVDIWNYKDDYLQPQQLKNKDTEEKRSYTAIYDWINKSIVQLGNEWTNPVFVTAEGDGDYFYGTSDSGMRQASQWQGFTVKKAFVIDPATGKATQIKANLKGNTYPSYTGKYLLMFDEKLKQYSVYNAATKATYQVAKQIPYPLYDEENDVPDDPNAYGIVKWMEDDKAVLIYDHFDVWKIDPENKEKPVCLTNGRKDHIEFRVIDVDREKQFIAKDQTLYYRMFDEDDKSSGIAKQPLTIQGYPTKLFMENVNTSGLVKAKYIDVVAYTKETFKDPTALYSAFVTNVTPTVNFQGNEAASKASEQLLVKLNPQQSNYLWGTAEIFMWTAYTGKLTEGVLYKPENFDPNKKYPMIVYFYERNNNTLHSYQAPAPTPSRLNIPFFVSRGYVVFVPDIWYKTGYPGKSAYDYIVSGTRAVVKKGFVDSTKIGLQGQSWGGYQIAYLITRTPMYAAAWAGAPVANMTSAYGGIRWGSGVNRQFQYEKTQSRIGASLWERPDLYIENSPLFQLPKVKTPLVIMANDGDDAVPWYQGIEMFTAMKRLGKPVWMLNYNGEAHNLVERKNRKDISIREQQYFDWLLKGEKPPRWIVGGVPAVLKGKEMGLSIAE